MPSKGYISSKWISHARRVERAGVDDVLADVGEGLAREVVALEVAEAELELPLPLLPDRVEVLEERRDVALDARRRGSRAPTRTSW